MKSIKIIRLFVISIILVAINSCKKYEEGPTVSIRTKKTRITGEWNITSMKNNGGPFETFNTGSLKCVDGNFVSYTSVDKTTKWAYTIKRNGEFFYARNTSKKLLDYLVSFNNCSDYYTNLDYVYSGYGKWKFASEKEQIEFDFENGTIWTFDILKLRNKEMKLKGVINGQLWEFTFTHVGLFENDDEPETVTPAGYDGTYTATFTDWAPGMGTISNPGSFVVSNGQISQTGFTGTVSSDGTFTGSRTQQPGNPPIPICGKFSSNSEFTLTSNGNGCSYGSNTVGATIKAHK